MSLSLNKAITRYNNLSKYVNRSYSDKAVEVLPGINSDDPRLLNLAREFSDSKSDLVASNKSGFLEEPFILGNFDAMRQIAGFPQNPLGSKPPQNLTAPKDSESFLKILKMVTRTMTAGCSPTGISINKISSIGFPFRTFDLGVKLKTLYNFIGNYDMISSMSESTFKGDTVVDDWIKKFDFAPISLEGRRFQHTDKIIREGDKLSPKLRTVFDWTGRSVEADRRISGYTDFFRVRSRFVFGAPGSLNYGAQFFANALRKYMSNKYEFMFYTGPHNFASKVSNFNSIVSADISAFDQNFDDKVASVIIDNIQCYDDSIKNLMRLMVRMPVLQKNDYLDESGFKLSSPTDAPLPEVSSNPSGWAWVTEFSKIAGVAIMVAAASKVLSIDESNIDDLLIGNLPISFMNTGDDMVFCFKTDEMKNLFMKMNGDSPQFHTFKLEFEKQVSYLGMSLIRDSSGTRSLMDVRNVMIKTHIPERSIGSIHKPFFAFGFRAKLDIYSNHPAFNDLFRSWNRLFTKYFGEDILSIVKLDKLPPVSSGDITNLANAIFLDNPDAIHYKIDINDVDKSVYNNVFAFVERDHFKKLEQHLRFIVEVK